VSISATLRQGHTIKVTTVASRWQRVGDLIGSRFEPHTSRNRSERLTACAITQRDYISQNAVLSNALKSN